MENGMTGSMMDEQTNEQRNTNSIAEGIMWLNLLLGNKQNHQDLSSKLGNLSSDVNTFKETLLNKMEVRQC